MTAILRHDVPLRIRALRRERGLSMAGFAALVGRSIQAVSKWELGQTLPPADLLPTIASVLDCTVDSLFTDGMPQEEAPH
jgi:transcriptional regulator with XRE-family HTH domain